MIVDIFSRKIVGAEVYDQELGELAAAVLQRTALSEKCIKRARHYILITVHQCEDERFMRC